MNFPFQCSKSIMNRMYRARPQISKPIPLNKVFTSITAYNTRVTIFASTAAITFTPFSNNVG